MLATKFYTKFSKNFRALLRLRGPDQMRAPQAEQDVEFQRDQEVAQARVAVSSFACVSWGMNGCRAILPVRC